MLWSALILGLLGSFHCIGMCGPIAFMLPVDRSNSTKKVIQISIYHFGRLLAYSIIGLVFGLVGKSLYIFGLQQQLSIVIGILMIVVVLIPVQTFNKYNFSKPVYRIISKVKSALGKALKKKTADTFLTIGFLNGFLPCGLVYMALFAAIASGNAINGSLYMAVFGIGTLPTMLSIALVGNLISLNFRKNIQRVIPFLLLAFAILFILRGLNLDIPYISPQLINSEAPDSIPLCN